MRWAPTVATAAEFSAARGGKVRKWQGREDELLQKTAVIGLIEPQYIHVIIYIYTLIYLIIYVYIQYSLHLDR